MLVSLTSRISPASAFRPFSRNTKAWSSTTHQFSKTRHFASSVDDLLSSETGFEISLETALAAHDQQIQFIDGTWWLPTPDRATTARQDFEQGPRIPGAIFLDIDDLSTKTSLNLPHMMPPPNLWEAYMHANNIGDNQQHLIVYGQATNCMFVHRAFVQLLSMGHDPSKLHLCQASLEEWQAAGGPIDEEPTTVMTGQQALEETTNTETGYKATDAQAVVDKASLQQIIEREDKDYQIVDVRSADRFYARVDEPRPGLRLGHMPGAQNLFFRTLLDDKAPIRLKSKDELTQIFVENGLLLQDGETSSPNERTVVASCGSGATACTLKAALMKCGKDPSQVLIYDGSWCEWGADPDTPIVATD